MAKSLLRETNWNRVYRMSDSAIRWESKFLDPTFSISAAFIRERWDDWGDDEQLDFSLAFAAKRDLSKEDEEIVEYLMEVADADVCSNLASIVSKISDKSKAISLLVARIERQQRPLSNYYSTISFLDPTTAVPILRGEYKCYLESSFMGDYQTIRDYAHCSKELLALEGDEKYRNDLAKLSQSADERVSRLALRLLDRVETKE